MQGGDDRSLALGRDSPDRVSGEREVAQLVLSLGNFLTVADSLRRDSHIAGYRRHGGGGVAREHLHLDALVEQESDRRTHVGTQTLGEHHQTHRAQIARRRVAVGGAGKNRALAVCGARANREGDHAPALALEQARALGQSAEGEALGGSQDIGELPEAQGGEASLGAEGDLLLGLMGLGWEGLGQRAHGGVGGGSGGGEPGERLNQLLFAGARGRLDARHAQGGLGERAGLSTQITSTEASDSIALSCWASTPRRAMRMQATA